MQIVDFDYNIWGTVDEYRLAVLSTYPGTARFELVALEQRENLAHYPL